MRKLSFILFLVLVQFHLFANMSQPATIAGTTSSPPYIHENVSIEHEIINISFSDDFRKARYDIKYFINVEVEGIDIPLLFHAMDYDSAFSIKLDNKPIEIQNPGNGYLIRYDSLPYWKYGFLKDIRGHFQYTDGCRLLKMYDHFKYFQTDLSVGRHIVEVTYYAESWYDDSDLVTKFWHKYALYPARCWKSFNGLKLTVNGAGLDGELGVEFEQPDSGSLSTTAVWNFDSLPSDYIKISYDPDISKIAELLVSIRSERMVLGFGILLALLHLWLIYIHRRKYNRYFVSFVVVIGGLLYPVLIILSWDCFAWIIMKSIGPAGNRPYVGIGVFILLQTIIPFYWLGTIIIDLFFKIRFKRLRKQNQ